MPLWLRERAADLQEWMDDPNGCPEKLANTLHQFTRINRRLSGWRRIFDQHIKPHCTDPHRVYTLLDIGFGGGDIARDLYQRAQQAGIRLSIEAIDTDRRALDFVQQFTWPEDITFHCVHHRELLEAGRVYDFVIGNHLLHHLQPAELSSLLRDADQLARQAALFADLRRSDWAYVFFFLGTLGRFRHSYIRPDGLRSIRRSYTQRELAALAPARWQIRKVFPFRLWAIRHHAS